MFKNSENRCYFKCYGFENFKTCFMIAKEKQTTIIINNNKSI